MLTASTNHSDSLENGRRRLFGDGRVGGDQLTHKKKYFFFEEKEYIWGRFIQTAEERNFIFISFYLAARSSSSRTLPTAAVDVHYCVMLVF